MAKYITDEQLYQDYILDDMSFVELSKKYNVCQDTIWRWLKRAELKKRDRYPGEDAFKEKFKELKGDRFALSVYYEISYSTVSLWERKSGVYKKRTKRTRNRFI